MITKRYDRKGHTEIAVSREGAVPPWDTYRIFCMDVDIVQDKRVPPTAHIKLLSPAIEVTADHTRRLAREYDYVADVAEALQAEKRAAYAEPRE